MIAIPWSFGRGSTRRAVLASVAVGCALAAPVVTLAERPTTMPTLPRADRSEQRDHSDRDRRPDREKGDKGEWGGERGERGFGPRRELKVTDEEWVEIAKFMSENSPNMWAVFDNLHEKHKAGAKSNIARRYFSLKSLGQRDPTLYEIELRRVKIEDGIFGIVGDIRKTGDQEREKQKKLKEQLHDKVEELWAVRMEDRAVQLARIERQLQGFQMDDTLKALREEREVDAAEKKAKWVQGRYETLLGLGRGGRPGMNPGRGRAPDRPASKNGDERRDDHKSAQPPAAK
jgi:hypothetical protein